MQVPASASAPLAPFATSTGATSAAPEDLGPLAWVVGEVQKSLESAGKLLHRFARDSQGTPGLDVANLRTARQQLHQTVGALQLVGHSAPALVLGAMEFSVQSFVEEPMRCTEAAVVKVERAGFAVVDFLQALLAGKSVSSVALFPQYREVLELVSNERVHPADLWSEPWRWVDISLPSRQPALVYDPAVRSKLDREVLKVIKGGDDVAARRLHELCLGLARGSAVPHVGSFWTLAAAFFDAISLALVSADVFVKRAASRVLLQYATLARNDSTVSDRLAQDLLFFCAQAVPGAVDQAHTLRAVRAAWKIEQHQAVDYTSEQFGRFDPVVLVQVRKRIDAAKEMWSALAGGDLSRLRQVADAFSQLGESLQKLHPPSQPMAQALANAVDASLKSAQAPGTELAMEVATSVLYLEAAFEDLDPHDRQLTARTVQLAGRIERAREGGRSEPLETWMEELYRRVSDRQSMGTVVDELRSHLGELEKSLDQFFRRPAEKGLLRAVPSQLLQMRGVLSVLGLDQAAQAVQRMRDTVDRLLAGDAAADAPRDYDSLGNNLGALGFLVDMLGYQPTLAKRLFVFDDVVGELKPLMGRQAADAEADAKAETVVEAEAAPATPAEPGLPAAVNPGTAVAFSSSAAPAARDATVLSAGEIDAQIAARLAALGASPRPAASLIDEFSQAADSWNTRVQPPVPHEPLPDTEVTELEEEDLQDIFLAEAREVLQGGLAAVANLASQSGDIGELTVLRRAFHTLKGSSRMVGLTEFGEAAWSLERVLNTWLADQKPATPDLLSGTGQALRDFSTWVDAIASSQPHAWQAEPFQRLATAMGSGERVLSASGTEALAAAAREIAAAAAAEAKVEAAPAPEAPEVSQAPLIATDDEATLWAGLDGGRSIATRDDVFEPTDFLDFDGKPVPSDTQPGALTGAEGIDFLGSGPAPVEPPAPAIPMPDEPTVWVGLDDRSPQPVEAGAFARHDRLPTDSGFEPTDFLDFRAKPAPVEQAPATLAGGEDIDFFALAPSSEAPAVPEATEVPTWTAQEPEPVPATPEALEVPYLAEEVVDLSIAPEEADAPLPPLVDASVAAEPVLEAEPVARVEPHAEVASVVEPAAVAEPTPEAEPEPEPVLEAEAVVEDAVKVIGPLRIGIALYNVYLNEADEWSRQLVTEVGEWALEPHVRVADSTIGLAHSLAGSSATVGFSSLSAMARLFEAALQHLQLRGGGTVEHGAVVVHAADELRRLLHQFAAGFLKEPDPSTLRALRELAAAPLPAPVPAPVDEPPPAAEFAPEVPPEPALVELEPQPVALAEPLPVPTPMPLAPAEPALHDVVLEDSDEAMDLVDAVDAELFPIFEEEAAELLPQLGTALRTWVQHPDDPAPRASVLRTLHTLKGSARLAGAMRLGERAHRMESEIESIGTQYIDRAAVEQLMTRFDALQSTFEGLRAADSAAQAELAQRAIDASAAAAAAAAAAAPVVEPKPVALSDQPEDSPAAEAAAPAPSVVALPAPSMLAPLRPASNQAVRIRTQLLDRLVAQAGEVIITRSRLEAELGQLRSSLDDLTGNLDRLRQQLRDIEVQAESQMQSRLAQAKDSQQGFDPLEFDRFTRVQELTRMMAESVNDVATVQRTLQRTVQATEDDLSAQARQTRELQRGLLRTRMVEFEGISERLYRVVRQAGKDAGRQVRLDITGGTIEMDRGVLDRMTPAFEHLLRNSVAHGIEDADSRTRAGKDPSGLITIDLQHDGNDVSVSFRDDGGGLDEQRIAARAHAMGLMEPGQWLSPEDAAEMIFRPGFSTADSISELAGRGIGMDVVRSHVAALGGRIETRSVAGQGTTFKLVLPLTTAVTHVVMLRAGNTSIGVPSNLIELVQRAGGADVERAYQSKSYTFGGEQIPFFWMGALLQSSARSDRAPGKTNTVVVVRSAAQRVAMHVDEVLGNQEVVVKNLGPQLSRLAGMAGITVLASGAVALIYNPVALAGVHGEQARALQGAGTTAAATTAGLQGYDGHVAPAPRQAPAQVPLVLVVDDSITVRRVTQRLLQREGYRVSLAADGLQALERLQQERPAVVLSDIEMPRMDGFDLARNIRADQAMADLPIIMITSRIAEKHRDHAKQLGVNHYLGKPYSEDELMRLVRSYARTDMPVALAA